MAGLLKGGYLKLLKADKKNNMNVHSLFANFNSDGAQPFKSTKITSFGMMPELAIRSSIRAIKQRAQVDEMFSVVPLAHQAIVKLSGFITREFPDKDLCPILDKVLLNMLVTYENNVGTGDMKSMISALYGDVLNSVNDIADFMVRGITVSGEIRTWEPLSEPIVNWVRRDGIVELQWFQHDWFGVSATSSERRWLRYLMASKIFTFGEIAMLDSSGVING